ncbi:MAG TPA: methyltransferase domain-containing protein [Thermomicrobiales bacterium]|nr:methyltransferase domain-containing protein [Thermomicrobiales bacterium]
MDNSQSIPAQPFDAVATGYDAAFTSQRLGQWLREMVWERLAASFAPGQHVLELGCGTGEDAIWLAQRGVHVTATDASPAMLAETQRKVEQAGVRDWVTVAELDMNALAPPGKPLPNPSPAKGGALDSEWQKPLPSQGRGWGGVCRDDGLQFDGAYSNFGPLNCVQDRPALFNMLAQSIRPGGRLVLVVMGPVCPWEIGWFLGHGNLRAARRRFRAGAEARVGDSTLRVWYPSQRRLRAELEPSFRTLEVAGIGLLLPPSDMGGLVNRAPKLAERLARIDRRMAHTLPWRWLNDHYLLVLERR